MHTWLYLMLSKKKHVGAAHVGPQGVGCVPCWKCSWAKKLSAPRLLVPREVWADCSALALFLPRQKYWWWDGHHGCCPGPCQNKKSQVGLLETALQYLRGNKHKLFLAGVGERGIRGRLKLRIADTVLYLLQRVFFLIVSKINGNLRISSTFYLIPQIMCSILPLSSFSIATQSK